MPKVNLMQTIPYVNILFILNLYLAEKLFNTIYLKTLFGKVI